MNILSAFTHPQVVANLYVYSAKHKGRYFEETIQSRLLNSSKSEKVRLNDVFI